MITEIDARRIGADLGVNWLEVDVEQFRQGIQTELEHTDDPAAAARIALDHLHELPDYYTRLTAMERNGAFSIRNGKAQWVRVLDVVFIGPLMVAGGVALTKQRPLWGVVLGAMGIGTVLYNARNWWVLYESRRSTRQDA